jgi:hypothetical protein
MVLSSATTSDRDVKFVDNDRSLWIRTKITLYWFSTTILVPVLD